MSERLVFPDPLSAGDALTFASRAARLTENAVRLQAADGVLAMTAAPLTARGLLDSTPTVLAMRALSIDPQLECDLVVEASALVGDAEDALRIVLPALALSAPWAGISPPRANWEHAGEIAASTLAARAQWGIAAVAEGVPKDAGEDAVRAVRATVWGRPDDALDGLPLGAAFAAFVMGFIVGDETGRVFSSATWTRISLQRGHVLVRGPVRSGLTAVRATGGAGG